MKLFIVRGTKSFSSCVQNRDFYFFFWWLVIIYFPLSKVIWQLKTTLILSLVENFMNWQMLRVVDRLSRNSPSKSFFLLCFYCSQFSSKVSKMSLFINSVTPYAFWKQCQILKVTLQISEDLCDEEVKSVSNFYSNDINWLPLYAPNLPFPIWFNEKMPFLSKKSKLHLSSINERFWVHWREIKDNPCCYTHLPPCQPLYS